jgi:hypothetical protein
MTHWSYYCWLKSLFDWQVGGLVYWETSFPSGLNANGLFSMLLTVGCILYWYLLCFLDSQPPQWLVKVPHLEGSMLTNKITFANKKHTILERERKYVAHKNWNSVQLWKSGIFCLFHSLLLWRRWEPMWMESLRSKGSFLQTTPFQIFT